MDWQAINDVDPDIFADDEDECDKFYDMVVDSDLTADDLSNAEDAVKLFKICKDILMIKNGNLEEALGEIDTIAEKSGKAGAKEVRQLQDENHKLKEELQLLKSKFSGMNSGEGIINLEKNINFEKQIKRLKDDLEEFRDLYETEKQDHSKTKEKLTQSRSMMDDLKKENDQLKEELQDQREEMYSQNENVFAKGATDLQLREQLRAKNNEILEYLDEIPKLTNANQKLQQEAEELTMRLKESLEEMELMTNAHMKIKELLFEADLKIEDLSRENEILREKIDENDKALAGRQSGEDAIMATLANKVDEWKEILRKKDDEILHLHEQMEVQKERIGLAEVDLDRKSFAELQKTVKERNETINKLMEQINEHTRESEVNAQYFNNFKSGGKSKSRQLSKIVELQTALKEAEINLQDAVEAKQIAERDCAFKERDMIALESRMHKYESGEYGLSEAVMEIKDLKANIRSQDSNVEHLLRKLNDLESKINDVMEENEDLREKLGEEKEAILDLSVYRSRRKKKTEQQRALKLVLLDEVEKLEEERLELKKQMRLIAMDKGQRAAALGLTADEMMRIDEFTENLRNQRESFPTFLKGTSRHGRDDIDEVDNVQGTKFNITEDVEDRIRNTIQKTMEKQDSLFREMGSYQKRIDGVEVERNEWKLRYNEKKAEVDQLVDLVKDLKDSKISDEQVGGLIDKMISMLEDRTDAMDSNLVSKARLDQLSGRNDELRSELKSLRSQNQKLIIDNDRLQTKNSRLEEDVKLSKEMGMGMMQVKQITLPSDLPPSSSDIIAALNEHLIQVLQELSLKEERILAFEEALLVYRRRLATIRHQQGLLYKEHLSEKDEWKQEMDKITREKTDLMSLRDTDKIKIDEFERLQRHLGSSDTERDRDIAELSRKITVLRVNERSFIRKFRLQSDHLDALTKDKDRLSKELTQSEINVTKRIGYLERFKEMALFRLNAMQHDLSESCLLSDYNKLEAKFDTLNLKYRDILEKENVLISKSASYELLEAEKNKLADTLELTKKHWELDKEKLATFEIKPSVNGGGDVNVESSSISKKIAMLEMKEINERQRAEHSSRMYESQKTILRDLEDRNQQLEAKFSELSGIALEAQKTEQELRDELSRSVTQEMHRSVQAELLTKTHSEKYLKNETSKLTEMVDVANLQVRSLQHQDDCQKKELEETRAMLLQLGQASNENRTIAQLHHDKVNLLVREATLTSELGNNKEKLRCIEAASLRIEQALDERQSALYHAQLENRTRVQHLRQTIHSLRIKYSGAIPLDKQEHLSNTLHQLHSEKSKLQKEAHECKQKQIAAEESMEKIAIQMKGLQELTEAIKNNKSAAKLTEWHAKMTDIRLQELKSKREIERLKEKVRYLEKVILQNESSMTVLEQQHVLLAKELEEQQIGWEKRETELEAIIDKKSGHEKLSGIARSYDLLPDPHLPLSEQLDTAVTRLRQMASDKNQLQRALDQKKKELKVAEVELENKNSAVISRDKIINELRLRMPASSDRVGLFNDVISDLSSQRTNRLSEKIQENLKLQLKQKETEVEEYKHLLDRSKAEISEIRLQHNEEVRNLQQKISDANQKLFKRFKDETVTEMNKGKTAVASNKQLERLAELEDMVAEQTNAMATLAKNLNDQKKETYRLTEEMKVEVQHLEEGKHSLKEKYEKEIEIHNSVNHQLKDEIIAHREEIDLLKEELKSQKEANDKAPTTSMRNLVDKLKKDLENKDHQMKLMTKALSELRHDMVYSAAEAAKSKVSKQEDESTVQHLVEAETKNLNLKLKDFKEKLGKLKLVVKRQMEKEVNMESEINRLQDEVRSKTHQLRKLHNEKVPVDLNRPLGSRASTDRSSELDQLRQELRKEKRENVLAQKEITSLTLIIDKLKNKGN